MEEKDLTCRHCGRPIAVAMSTCPWPDCRATIMVICAACRAYTDDQGELCEQCGEPLVAATFQEVELPVSTQALLKQLALDQERALLVASGVIARYSGRFFGDKAPPQGVLAALLGVPLTASSRAAALLFAAVAYLVQAGKCDLERAPAIGPEFLWVAADNWEGQMDSLEARMAAQAWQSLPFGEAIRHMIAREIGFHLDDPEIEGSPSGAEQDTPLDPAPSRVPSALNRLLERLPRRQARASDLPSRPAAITIVELGWETVLPPHEETPACEEASRVLGDFEEADPQRAQYLLSEIRMVLDWFGRVEQDPDSSRRGPVAMRPDAIEGESNLAHVKAQAQANVADDSIEGKREVTPALPDLEDESSDENHL